MSLKSKFFSAVLGVALTTSFVAEATAQPRERVIPDHFHDRYGSNKPPAKDDGACHKRKGWEGFLRDGNLYSQDFNNGRSNFSVYVDPRSGGESTIGLKFERGIGDGRIPC